MRECSKLNFVPSAAMMKSTVRRIPFANGPTNLCTAAMSGLVKFHDGSIVVWRAHHLPVDLRTAVARASVRDLLEVVTGGEHLARAVQHDGRDLVETLGRLAARATARAPSSS